MKEFIKKFVNAAAADNYVITHIPFTTSVATDPIQNLVCNKTGKHLENDNGIVIICPPDIFVPNAVKFTAQEANSTIGLEKLSLYQTLEYSSDLSNWSSMTTATTITLTNSGDTVYIRGVLSDHNTYNNYTQFKMTGKIAASGNCNYLWNYENPDALLKEYCGYYMFEGCTSLTTTPELPATTLANSCYSGMFQRCTSLTTAPALLVTTLATSCYADMFNGCTSLTTAPELPATTLVDYCYSGMFNGCTSLTTAPELPATTLVDYCYNSMFYGCTSLTTAPALPATRLADSCYWGMFNGCTSLTTAPELPATTLANYCYKNMFFGCTSLTTAPELPATTLVDYCYNSMFYGCTSLTTAPELPATTLAKWCYTYMFNGCSSLNYIKCLAIDISVTNCTNSWVLRVASTGTFVKAANMTGWTTGANGIPTNWTVEDAQ